MAGDDDDLLGVLSSLPVGDDIEAGGVGKGLGGESEMEANGALAGEVAEQVGVFSGNCSGRNFGDAIGIRGETGMREPKIRSADVFQLVTTPSRLLPIMAAVDDSMIAAW